MKTIGEYLLAFLLIILMIPVFLFAMLLEVFMISRYLRFKSM